MSQPYIGEIRAVGFPRVPQGYLPCNGQLLQISIYEVLFTLIGTTYGGDGVTTFAAPDLRGQRVVHQGTGAGLTPRVLAQKGGTEEFTLTAATTPAHTHAANAVTSNGTSASPNNALFAGAIDVTTPATIITEYLPNTAPLNLQSLDPSTVQTVGSSLPHENRMGFLTINYIIAYLGIWPSQN